MKKRKIKKIIKKLKQNVNNDLKESDYFENESFYIGRKDAFELSINYLKKKLK